MPTRKRSLTESLSLRRARVRRKTQSHRILRWIGARGLATVVLGTALSVGGATEAFQSGHLLDFRYLDTAKTAAKHQPRRKTVAKAALVPASDDTTTGDASDQLLGLHFFDDVLPADADAQSKDVFHEEMKRINVAIRREFFTNSVPFGNLIHAKAQKYDVDPSLLAAVVETESSFRAGARSQVGARGLMQLMPRTGRWMGARNLYNADQNVDAGARYLKYLTARFDGDLTKTIAAYNAGEGNVRRYNGVPPFRETRSYVSRVMSRYEKRKRELKQFDDRRGSGGGPEDAALTLR